jgi:hypothetical protein
MPTLSVSVFNKKDDKIINENYPNIVLDDSIKKIKDKLFVFYPEFIPNLIKLELKNKDGSYTTIKDSNSLLFEHFDIIPDRPVIFVSNLQNTISQVNLQELYVNDNKFKSAFQEFKNEYTDLTEDDLLFIIKLNLLNIGFENINISDIQDYVKDNQNKRNKLISIIEEQENDSTLQEFYKLSKEFTPEIDKVSYNNISLIIIGENVSYGTKGVFIKLNEIFNILE